MRIGLLVCDHVDTDLREVAGDYPDMFEAMLAPFGDLELVSFDLTVGDFPASATECDGWMTTGSRSSVYDPEPWIGRMAGLVRSIHVARRPYLGICFGHQMIAHALGGTVARSPAGWGAGVKELVLSEPASWTEAQAYRILASHYDQITRLPVEAVVLGSSDYCANSMIGVGDHMVGMQGHPEFRTEYLRALILKRRGTAMPVPVADEALGSLDRPVDAAALAQVVADFFRERRDASSAAAERREAQVSAPGE